MIRGVIGWAVRGSLIALLLGTAVEPTADSPAGVVAAFYKTYKSLRSSGGLPNRKDLPALKPFLSTRLHGLIVDALDYHDEWVKRYRNEPPREGGPSVTRKPPFANGEYFASHFDGFHSFAIEGTARGPDETWKVTVRFQCEAAEEWRDAVLVRREASRYVIDDVALAGSGSFSPGGRLSDALRWREGKE